MKVSNCIVLCCVVVVVVDGGILTQIKTKCKSFFLFYAFFSPSWQLFSTISPISIGIKGMFNSYFFRGHLYLISPVPIGIKGAGELVESNSTIELFKYCEVSNSYHFGRAV